MASQRKQVTGEASHPGDYAVVYLVLCFARHRQSFDRKYALVERMGLSNLNSQL